MKSVGKRDHIGVDAGVNPVRLEGVDNGGHDGVGLVVINACLPQGRPQRDSPPVHAGGLLLRIASRTMSGATSTVKLPWVSYVSPGENCFREPAGSRRRLFLLNWSSCKSPRNRFTLRGGRDARSLELRHRRDGYARRRYRGYP